MFHDPQNTFPAHTGGDTPDPMPETTKEGAETQDPLHGELGKLLEIHWDPLTTFVAKWGVDVVGIASKTNAGYRKGFETGREEAA